MPAPMISQFFDRQIREDTTLKAPCEIRDDGSLVCWPAEEGGSELSRIFGLVSESYRVAPTLADGSSSAGLWVELVLDVKVVSRPVRRAASGGG